MMRRYEDTFPWEKLITYRFGLDQAQEALERSSRLDALKVVFVP